jgi:hypothetical protein
MKIANITIVATIIATLVISMIAFQPAVSEASNNVSPNPTPSPRKVRKMPVPVQSPITKPKSGTRTFQGSPEDGQSIKRKQPRRGAKRITEVTTQKSKSKSRGTVKGRRQYEP